MHLALHKMSEACPVLAKPSGCLSAEKNCTGRCEDLLPLGFKCCLLGFTSQQVALVAFPAATEETIPSFKGQPEQWMLLLLLLLYFYLQSSGNLSP